MIGKTLVCPACESTDFEVKNTEGNIMLHCNECTHKVVVRNGGLIDAQINNYNLKQIVLPTPREKNNKRSKGSEFCTMQINMTLKQRSIIKASFNICKQMRNVEGRSFQGTTLYWLAVDYLSGVEYSQLSPDNQILFDEAMKINEDDDVVPVVRKKEPESEDLFTDEQANGVKEDEPEEDTENNKF